MVPRYGTPLTMSIVVLPDDASARVCLAGDVDFTAKPALVEAVERLSTLPLRCIVVDLSAVTFTGSPLAHFIDALHAAHPAAEIVLHDAPPLVHVILAATGQDRFVATSGGPHVPFRGPTGKWNT